MTKRLSDIQPVIDFINIAKEFCHLLESRDGKNVLQLLQGAYIILPNLCLCAMKLPIIKKFSDYDLPEMSSEQYFVMYKSLHSKFKEYDSFQEIFDPCNLRDKELIPNAVSHNLSEIYQDIVLGLREWEKANANRKRAIIWDWKLLFEKHWGDHATTAFRALHFLLNNHIEDEYGYPVGIREDVKKFKPVKE